MPHDVTLIATLAGGFGLALIFGLAASYLKMPPLLGYLIAGVMIGLQLLDSLQTLGYRSS